MQYGYHLLSSRAGVSLLVAAANAPDTIRERADYICGGNNDHVTIQAAINALVSDGQDRRGTIQLSEGDYQIAGTIQIPGHVQLVGAGWGTKLQATSGLNASMIQFLPHSVAGGSVSVGAEGIRIADLFMDHNAAAQTAGSCIDGYGARSCVIEHCHFSRPHDSAIVLRALADGSVGRGNVVSHCLFEDGALSPGDGCALSLSGSSENMMYANSIKNMGGAGTNAAGIADAAGFNLYEGNRFMGCKQALAIANQTGCRIIGNIFDGGTGDQLLMNGSNHTVTGNTFCNVGVGNPASTAHAINMSTACTGCSIMGNVFSNDGGQPECFVLESSSGNSGNTFTVGNNVITGNNFQITGAGISFLAVIRNSIRSSIIRHNIGYVTESKGTTSIASGQTSVVVTHGLSIAPQVQDISILSTSNTSTFYVFINSITSTTFTITIPSAAPAGNDFFAWHATIL